MELHTRELRSTSQMSLIGCKWICSVQAACLENEVLLEHAVVDLRKRLHARPLVHEGQQRRQQRQEDLEDQACVAGSARVLEVISVYGLVAQR